MIFHEMERAALFAYKIREKIFGSAAVVVQSLISGSSRLQTLMIIDQLFQLIIISIIIIT